ncbi:MAG: hypothetical protein ACI85I_001394 [Arenicella sp.]|jgi:hypothetical protein
MIFSLKKSGIALQQFWSRKIESDVIIQKIIVRLFSIMLDILVSADISHPNFSNPVFNKN